MNHATSDFVVAPYVHTGETATEMLLRLGYRRESGTDRIIRLADGKCVVRTRSVFVMNDWAVAGCPDLDGASFQMGQQ